ncbi:conserved hypothetical protein [Brevundimonas subvibrioides ATCC 15264]|uniref:TIGR02281 family clan AA aspartic protease n=1 Tax=Brevundimonas subvibrioides (strain ATCC 15264 / DSM 4735 / LMG 14903 / NBRC 16000 / CB 81) TaxID=633149 RepID=D9QNV4_BRESC|nr:conserved hypothetical protein [Brevundimonas subvibrioides ATCC 15264]
MQDGDRPQKRWVRVGIPLVRFDLQSAIVMGMATVSSLAVAWVLSHQSPRAAEAATPVQPMAQSVIVPVTGQPAQIAKSADGHFWAEADIDGRAIRVLVDTGASVVALTRDDALRLGLRLTPADFNRTVETASGPAKAAAIQLDHVAVAGARVERVQALVVEKGLPHSLLGMSYLGRLSAFEARPTGLTLRP